ncbi:ATP-binding protein [Streptomyces sp. SPB78]|uniref:ATP-binding protein n=1 Tax=Streptomyces sp. (strain SPB78) TaxID=591157 RepID=UPI0007C6890D|nr:ATP-binding protein [Streptomyces sp. SPB78]
MGHDEERGGEQGAGRGEGRPEGHGGEHGAGREAGRAGAGGLRPGEARERVYDVLLAVRPPVDVLVLADAVLVASELVSNAVRHAGGVTGFRVSVGDGEVEISVSDGSDAMPVERTPRPLVREGGYGWGLVRRLARVEVVEEPGSGKTVRARLPLTSAHSTYEHPGFVPAQRKPPRSGER